MNPLRYATASPAAQRAAFVELVRQSTLLDVAFNALRVVNPPRWRLVSGALYNTVWNLLTGHPAERGVKDVDVFYFDADHMRAEDEAAWQVRLPRLTVPFELRNQARVHTWYPEYFGLPYSPLSSTEEGIDRFVCQTHAVGMHVASDGTPDVYAPFGLAALFAFRLVPNAWADNRKTYFEKARRAKALWPLLTVEPWPTG